MGPLMIAATADAGNAQQSEALPVETLSRNDGIVWKAISASGFHIDLVPTIHVFSRHVALPARIVMRVDAAAKIFIEANPDDPVDRANAIKLCRYAAGDDVFKHLSVETRALLTDRINAYGISATKVKTLKPWAISLLLQDVEKRKARTGKLTSVEAKLIDEAHRSGVPVLTFESIEQQFAMFDSFPDPIQDLMLRSYLRQNATSGQTRAALKNIEQAWSSGDIKRVGNEISALDPYPPQISAIVEETMLSNRNLRFVDRILAETKSLSAAPFVVAVGFNHFTGPRGILSLLKEQGFLIENA